MELARALSIEPCRRGLQHVLTCRSKQHANVQHASLSMLDTLRCNVAEESVTDARQQPTQGRNTANEQALVHDHQFQEMHLHRPNSQAAHVWYLHCESMKHHTTDVDACKAHIMNAKQFVSLIPHGIR